MTSETPPDILIAEEVSQWIRIKRSTTYAWAAAGKIPSIKINGSVRFIRTQIQQWLDDRSNHLAGAPPSPTRVIIPPKITPVSRHILQQTGVRAIRRATNTPRGQLSLKNEHPPLIDITTPRKDRV
jgi:excisionase family DNA binding protein